MCFTTQSKGVHTEGRREGYLLQCKTETDARGRAELGRKENVVLRCVTMRLKTYMESEERKDFLLESGFLLMSASESQTDKAEQMGQGRGIHAFQTKASR